MLSFLKKIKDYVNGYLYTYIIRPYLEWDSEDRYSEFNMTPVEKYEPKHGDVMIKLTRTELRDIFDVIGVESYPVDISTPYFKKALKQLFKYQKDFYLINYLTSLTIELWQYGNINVYIGDNGKRQSEETDDFVVFSVLHEGSSYVDKVNKLINLYHVRIKTTMESAYNYAQPIEPKLIKPDSVVIFKNYEDIVTGIFRNLSWSSISFSGDLVSTNKNDYYGVMRGCSTAIQWTRQTEDSIRLSDTKSYERIKSIRNELYQKLYEFTVAEMQDERNKRYEQ